MKDKKKELIEKRKSFLYYDEAKLIQKELIDIYAKEYKPKHSPATYFKLIQKYGIGEITERHPQDTNWADTVFQCFSEVSQHVRGFTKEHCLDQVYDAAQQKKQRLKEYKKLPSLEELVNSKIKIHSNREYRHRDKTDYEDMCVINTGTEILEMRKIGIVQFRINELKAIAEAINRRRIAGK